MIVFELNGADEAQLQALADKLGRRSLDDTAQRIIKDRLAVEAAKDRRRARRQAIKEARP